ncbi:MAG: hypothetical protein Q9201_004358 [Fulgogasparrea decipioides]
METERNDCVCYCAPIFKGQERQFRITAPGQFDGCKHYVAVSYSWERRSHRDKSVPPDEKYTVQTENGVRAGSVPFDVINRAVAFAAIHHVGLIWIDQEVIDQNDITDISQGIQVMDMVYEQSLYPVAIIDTLIESQEQLDTLDYVLSASHSRSTTDDDVDDLEDTSSEQVSNSSVEMDIEDDATNIEEWSNNNASNPYVDNKSTGKFSQSREYGNRVKCESSEILSVSEAITGTRAAVLEDFLRSMAEDIYFTRAWTLQEHLTALNMSISIKVGPNLDVPNGPLKALRSTEVFYSMAEFGEQLKGFNGLNNRIFGVGENRGNRNLHDMVEHYSSVLDPSSEAESRRISRSAAEVLGLLQSRSNSVLSDRLAIVANLCSYDIRLDPIMLERRRHHSFSTSVLGLALLNGDISLLSGYGSAPDGLTEPYLALEDVGPALDPFGWGWCPPKHGRLEFLPSIIAGPEDDAPLRISPPLLTAAGLVTSGFVWKKSQIVDFNEFKNSQTDFVGHDYLEGSFWKRTQKVIWDILLSLVERGHRMLAEALWRFQFYDGETIKYGQPDYRPYHLGEVLDFDHRRVKRFGDPKITGNENYEKLFRVPAFESSLPSKVLAEGIIDTFRCISSDDNEPARAWFNIDRSGRGWDPESIDGVFTPLIQTRNGQYNPDPRYATISWAVRRSGTIHNVMEVLKCCGKVEGIWNVDGLEPKPFILS